MPKSRVFEEVVENCKFTMIVKIMNIFLKIFEIHVHMGATKEVINYIAIEESSTIKKIYIYTYIHTLIHTP